MSVETRGSEDNATKLTCTSLKYESFSIFYSREVRTRVRLTNSSYGLFVELHFQTTRMSNSDTKCGRYVEILEISWGKQIVWTEYLY